VAFQRLLNFIGRNAGSAVKSVLPGTAMTAGFGLMESPQAAAVYGLSDLALSLPTTLAARGLGAKITKPILGVKPEHLRTGIETTANIGAQLGSTVVAGKILYGDQQATSPLMLQEQQTMQRAAVNDLQQQLVSPGTQFQMTGLPSPEHFQSLLNQRNNWAQYLSPEDQLLLQQARGPIA
jgi:hypothetical protein